MAGPLAAVERFFERLFERPAARLFQARLEPVHLQRQLERAMEAERRTQGRRVWVPHRYRVTLHPSDLVALEGYGGSLGIDLAEALHAHARRQRYLLTARPEVDLEASRDVAAGEVEVMAQTIGGRSGAPPSDLADGVDESRQPLDVAPAAAPASAQPGRVAAHEERPPAEVGQTAIYASPAQRLPRAVLAVHTPGRPVSRVPVRSGTIRLGRALDNDLVLPDERVSRHHGQISVRLGTLVYTDLGSTNGSFLNGSAVTEIALGPTDVLQLGGSSLTVESGG